MPQGERQTPRIFISHRHDDKEIADIIKSTLQEWTNGNISIFQSSDPQCSTKIGEPLSKELADFLADSSVLFLIYTFKREDWEYCMWECGLAMNKNTKPTKITVLQCSDDTPKPFQDKVRVRFTEDEIMKLTEQFHKDPDFFPGYNQALHPKISPETLKKRGTELYNRLKTVIPEKKDEGRRRWDLLQLALDKAEVKKIQNAKDDDSATELSAQTIPAKCVVKDSFGEAFKHFGFDKQEKGIKFGDLVERWLQNACDYPQEWISELYAEMSRAIRNRPAKPTLECLKSLRSGTDWWFFPIINYVNITSGEDMEFDIYLYQIPPDLKDTIYKEKKYK